MLGLLEPQSAIPLSCMRRTKPKMSFKLIGSVTMARASITMTWARRLGRLRGIKLAILDGSNGSFSGDCGECGISIDFGARIEDEAVVAIWPLSYRGIGEPVAAAT